MSDEQAAAVREAYDGLFSKLTAMEKTPLLVYVVAVYDEPPAKITYFANGAIRSDSDGDREDLLAAVVAGAVEIMAHDGPNTERTRLDH